MPQTHRTHEEPPMARRDEPRSHPELLTGAELRDQLRQLPPTRRRELLRSVWRGERVDHQADAALAVSVARRQQRTAQFSWLVVPASTFALWAAAGLSVMVAIVGTVVAGYVATLVLARSVRAERTNRGLAMDDATPSPGVTTRDDGVSRRGRKHLPGERR
jgi:hypothetical protein